MTTKGYVVYNIYSIHTWSLSCIHVVITRIAIHIIVLHRYIDIICIQNRLMNIGGGGPELFSLSISYYAVNRFRE